MKTKAKPTHSLVSVSLIELGISQLSRYNSGEKQTYIISILMGQKENIDTASLCTLL